jgi:hypothetical protein
MKIEAGLKLVDEEAKQRATQTGHEQHHDCVVARCRHYEGGSDSEQTHASGQAVKPVDEVQGIDHADDPQQGEQQTERT